MSDLIDRENAISEILEVYEREFPTASGAFDEFAVSIVPNLLRNLPSKGSERKKGKWIEYPDCLGYDGAYSDDHIVCSECEHVFSILDNCTEEFDFCPHCGSYNGDMRGSDE